MRSRLLRLAVGASWALTVGAGYAGVLRYERTPGESGAVLPDWPEGSRLARDTHRSTLVMLAHPRCPCTRASLAELAEVMEQCPGRVTAYVLFYCPQHAPEGWARTDTWRTAASISGVRVARDDDGLEGRRFGGLTSGHVVVYDRNGRKEFSGGITLGRGHAGDNEGRQQLVRCLEQGSAASREMPVYGCPLSGPRQQEEE